LLYLAEDREFPDASELDCASRRHAVDGSQMTKNRIQLSLWTGLVVFLLASSFTFLLYTFVPETPASRGPLLLASFIAILIGSVLCILFLLRWLLRPYRKLVGEAERAAISPQPQSKDEAEFVLETFQSVVAQLDSQRKELQKLTELASERADSAERFSERIVASVPSGLIAFDGNGKSILINAPGHALLETHGDTVGEPSTSVLRNLPTLSALVQQCLETGKVFRREEIETTATNGAPRRIGATIAPIDLSSERGTRGVLCLLTDITEVTNLREQVALKRNLESLGEMSAGLAHEFKNTIATLHGYVQLLQNLNLDERGQVATESLLNEVRNLADMVTSFLNFARPQPLNSESISLKDLLAECAMELEAVFKERNVELQFASDGEEKSGLQEALVVPADERMLRQALLNLLRNAAEAIGDDQTDRLVEVKVREENAQTGKKWAVVQIRDTGSGIPLGDMQKIFIPFFTTKARGHGVGLALAHRVISQHGGSLEASNAPKGGAVFTVRLPL
jgi:signal transduction histidine kinase